MFLGLDLGTTNVKALVVDEEGRIAGEASAAVDWFHTPDGGLEQDVDQIWQAACDAVRRAVGQCDPAGIESIGISSQGGAVQLLDAQQKPLGRVISWLDSRGKPFVDSACPGRNQSPIRTFPCFLSDGKVLNHNRCKPLEAGYIAGYIFPPRSGPNQQYLLHRGKCLATLQTVHSGFRRSHSPVSPQLYLQYHADRVPPG